MADHILVNTKQFKTALDIAKKAIPARPTHPVLACYKIVFSLQSVTISSFDLANGIEVTFPIDNQLVEGEKAIAVSADLLYKTVSKIKKGELIEILFLEDNQLTIKGEKSETKISLMEAGEYPELPVIEDTNTLTIPALYLKQLISKGGYAVSPDETKQILTGMNMVNHEGKLQVCSTNGHQLAVSTLEQDEEIQLPDIGVVMSSSFIRLIESLKTVEDVAIGYNDKEIQLKAQFDGFDVRLLGRVLAGTYPAYHQLIPQSFTYCVIFDKQELLDSIDTATVVSDQKNQIIMIEPDLSDSLFSQFKISATTQDVGQSISYLSGEYRQGIEEKDSFPRIGLNATYIALAINHIPEREILLWVSASNKPVMVSGLGGGDYRGNGGLVMPVQIKN